MIDSYLQQNLLSIDTLALLCFLIIIWLLLEPWFIQNNIPPAIGLIFLGFVSSEILVAIGIDTGIRWHSFYWLVFNLLLPISIFQVALQLSWPDLRRHWLPISLLSIPFTLLCGFLIAILLHAFIGNETGFTWVSASVGAALLISTNPVMSARLVVTKIGKTGVWLSGESLFNIVKLVKEIRSYHEDQLKSRTLVVLSERIKVQAQSIGFKNVHVARTPSDKGTIIEILNQQK